MERHAGPNSYDGMPYGELPIDSVDWEHRADHISQRSSRKRQTQEFDVKPEWATEAALDPDRLVRDSCSEKGLSVEVVGHSVSAGRVLTVLWCRRTTRPQAIGGAPALGQPATLMSAITDGETEK